MITMTYGDLGELEHLCRQAEMEELTSAADLTFDGLVFLVENEFYPVDEVEDLASQLGIGFGMVDFFSANDPAVLVGRKSAPVDFS